MRDALWLVKNNVPFDVAFSLSHEERTAMGIVMCEFEGSEFDYNRWRWKERKP